MDKTSWTGTSRTVGAFVVLAMSACTVGPDFTKPNTTTPPGWSGLDPSVTGGAASKPSDATADLSAWWNTFRDDQLTALVVRAAEANYDVARAEARIRQARANRQIAASGGLPSIDVNADYSRSRPAVPGAHSNDLYRAGFDAAWEIDVFGGVRRSVEAAEAGITAAVADRNDVRVTLAGEVATNYFQLRGAQGSLVIARRNLAAQQQTLDLTKERFEAGFVSSLDVANARAQVATTASTIPGLEATIRATSYALGVLLGQEPASLLADLTPDKPTPQIPSHVPVGLPSGLLERRPDIRRATADLHAATARIGVATSDLFPRFALTGSVGIAATDFTGLGSIANHFWSIGPQMNWNVFSAGRVTGNIALQRAVAEEALAIYKQTVLVALQDVETALVNFTKEQERRTQLVEAVNANREAVDVATKLYSAGRTDFLNVLIVQGRLFAAEDALSQSERQVATNLVALYKALGGGWDTRLDE